MMTSVKMTSAEKQRGVPMPNKSISLSLSTDITAATKMISAGRDIRGLSLSLSFNMRITGYCGGTEKDAKAK